jgi:hypothetical protein
MVVGKAERAHNTVGKPMIEGVGEYLMPTDANMRAAFVGSATTPLMF